MWLSNGGHTIDQLPKVGVCRKYMSKKGTNLSKATMLSFDTYYEHTIGIKIYLCKAYTICIDIFLSVTIDMRATKILALRFCFPSIVKVVA